MLYGVGVQVPPGAPKFLKFRPDGVWKDSARKCRFVRTITWLVAVVAAHERGDTKMCISNVTV